MKRILNLPVKKKWFDLIVSGEKKIEYREYKQHWIQRLIKSVGIVIIMKIFDEIHFRNGYGKNRPVARVKHLDTTIETVVHPDTGKECQCFLIHLGEILEVVK